MERSRAGRSTGEVDAALEDLYGQFATTVERWVRRLGGPGAEVQDLLHDVFVVALRRRREFRGEASPQTWLFRITRNVIASRRRRDRLRRWLLSRHAEDPSAKESPPGTAIEQIEQRERHARLYRALDQLSESYRTVIILYELDGLSGNEIAALLGESLNNVWVRLHRARAKLLQALAVEKEGSR